MPKYSWLLNDRIDPADVAASVRALRKVGVPYSDADLANVPASLRQQGEEIVGRLAGAGIKTEADREVVALIAYLQRLGKDGRAALTAAAPTGATP
jgi:cytochrome c oxidase cbb3-type subunit I/II